jgi:hypothetical protein
MFQAVKYIFQYIYILVKLVEFPLALIILGTKLCLYFDLDYNRFALHNTYGSLQPSHWPEAALQFNNPQFAVSHYTRSDLHRPNHTD